MQSEPFLIAGVIVYEVCDDDRCSVFFMIGGKLMRLSLVFGEKFSF